MARQDLRRSFVTLLAARAVAKLLLFFFFVLVARRLGPAQFGAFGYHIVLAQLLSLLADLGFSATSIREAAAGRRPDVFGLALAAKLALIVPVLLVMPATARVASTSGDWLLGYLAVGVVLLDSFAAFFLGPMRLREELRPMAASEMVRAGTSLVFFGMASQATAATALLAYFLGALAGCLVPVALLLYRKELEPPRWNVRAIVALLRPSVVISLTSGLYILGNRVDVVILDLYKGSSEVGVYNSAYAFFTNISAIPLLASTVLFPRLAASAADSIATRKLVLRALAPLLATGAPIAICGPVMAESIVRLLYGSQYAMAGPLLAILLVPSGLVFLGNLLWYLLIASNKQTYNLLFVSVALGANIVMNLALVPRVGAMGAAVATLVMETVLVVLAMRSLRGLVTLWDVGRLALSPMLSACVTAVVCYPLRDIDAFYLLPTAAAAYVGLLWIASASMVLGRVAAFPFALRDTGLDP